MYNKTQLTPQKEFERHIYHRDQFAHYFRWTHVLKNAKIGQTILDMGCGSGEMIEVFYRNRYRPKKFVGIDIRDKVPEKLKELDFVEILVKDLCEPFDLDEKFDIITSFEVVEHIGHDNIDQYLENIKHHLGGTLYLSTPNYDPSVGAAKNHIINGEIGEWDHSELEKKLSEYFTIVDKFGTFASQKDYKSGLSGWQLEAFNELNKYYDSNLLSNLMAPMIDASKARNCLWVLK
ncbi:MAG: class I SAM-dependent methyltransferase [Turicibacter sanguinis]